MGKVDILVASWNTLPWLKLLVSQFRRLRPKIDAEILVMNSPSTDGAEEWLKGSGIRYIQGSRNPGHAQALTDLLAISTSPFVAFMDVDAAPVKNGWLEEAIDVLSDEKVGLVGFAHTTGVRLFVHPAFCVFRREVFDRLNLSTDVIQYATDSIYYDVGAKMSEVVELSGLSLRFLGGAFPDEKIQGGWEYKVFHFCGSTAVMHDLEKEERWTWIVRRHEYALRHFGLLDEFLGYARESEEGNPLLSRYRIIGR